MKELVVISGKLVTLIRRKAKEIATERGLDLIIADGSPGIGCPAIASITGADITERIKVLWRQVPCALG
jgi:MinD superfamily P-loop ATPase